MIKKFFSIICTAAIALSAAVPSLAAVNESQTNTVTNNIYVEGVAVNSDLVTLKMKNKTDNSLGYVDEISVEDDGTYKFKFKFNEDYTNYELSINDGDKNIADTVTLTKSESLGLLGNITTGELKDGEFTLTADMINKLDDTGSCKLIYASYDENGTLLGAELDDFSYGFNSGTKTATKTAKTGAAKVKVFMWQSLENCIPLSTAAASLPKKNIVLLGDSLGQTYDESDVTKGWGQYLGNYMNGGANIINCCHSGWNTLSFLAYEQENPTSFWLQGWNYAKSFLTEGDYVVFGLGYNDYGIKGYNGKYYDEVDGVRKFYYISEKDPYKAEHPNWSYDRQTDDGGKYIETEQGKIYTSKEGISDLTTNSNNGVLSYFYLDENGVKQAYSADAYYDNMKIMLDDCKKMGVNVVIRNVACISNPNSPQSRDNPHYHGFVTHAIINEKVEMLASEYDNVVAVDLFSESKEHFLDLYNSFKNEAPAYAYDANGNIKECYKDITNWQYQQLYDTYWLTIKTIGDYYKTGQPELLNDKWIYRKADGTYRIQDSLHYCGNGANYIASAIAKLIKQSESGLAEYVK